MADARRIAVGMGFFEILGPVIGAVAIAGGTVGSALITADAAKFQAKTAQKTQLQQILSQERIALAQEQGVTQRDLAHTQAEGSQFNLVAWGLLGLGFLWIWSK